MDDHIKLLAGISLDLSAAEDALEEGAHLRARERLDAADDGLATLRARWPGMTARERRLIAAVAGPVRERLDGAQARLPRLRAVAEVPPEIDPEQERDPEAA